MNDEYGRSQYILSWQIKTFIIFLENRVRRAEKGGNNKYSVSIILQTFSEKGVKCTEKNHWFEPSSFLWAQEKNPLLPNHKLQQFVIMAVLAFETTQEKAQEILSTSQLFCGTGAF